MHFEVLIFLITRIAYAFQTFITKNLDQRGTGVVCFSFFFWLRVLDKAEYSAFESTLNSTIVSYRIRNRLRDPCVTLLL